MPAASGVRRAGATLALGSFAALACSSDTIDLLPPQADAGAATDASSAGEPGQSGSSTNAGSDSKAGRDSGGASAASGGGCWNASCGGGGNAGTVSLGGFGFAGVAGVGSDFCLPGEPSECRFGYRCDVILGRCAAACENDKDCDEGRVCDPQQGTCVPCVHDFDCEFDDDLETHFCALRHCVECLRDQDCDRDSHSDRHCDVPRGRCE